MKIYYVHPFDLLRTPIEVDTDKDFEKRIVNTCGIVDSNKFLVSLWNQLNKELCPKHSIGRVPWAYFPSKFSGKKSHVSVIGFADTIIGELLFALMYRKKGDIDSLLFMRPACKLSHDEINTISNLITKAHEEKETLRNFMCVANIKLNLDNVSFANYVATNFSLSSTDKGTSILCFNIKAIDKFEAEQIALNKLYDACAFLTVETNVLCSFDKFKVAEGSMSETHYEKYFFINDFIDYYPLTKDFKLCVSKYGLLFLDKYIFINDRFEDKATIIRFFISSCKHCQIGLEAESRIEETVIAALPSESFALTKRDQKRKSENAILALMSYLSAIECSTAFDTNHEKCKECGAVKYIISSRVKNLATEYLGEHLGKVFYKLYNYRSKFLHDGKFPTDANTIRTIPLLSSDSANGLIGVGNFSVQVNGKTIQCSVKNVKEWSFYLLIAYYQKQIMHRIEFVDVFEETPTFQFRNKPLSINAVSPKGAILMKKVLVPTHKTSYNIKTSLRRISNNIKYRIYMLRKNNSSLN